MTAAILINIKLVIYFRSQAKDSKPHPISITMLDVKV